MTRTLDDAPYTLDDARNRRAWWTIAAAAVVACGVWSWVHFVQPANTGETTPSGTAFPWNRSGASGVTHPGSPASAARSGTDLALQTDAAGHLIVTRSVRNLFDSFLSASGTTPLPVVRERIVAHLDAHLPKTAAADARALLDHYLAYGAALQTQTGHRPLEELLPDERQARLYAIEDLRARHFSAAERQAFFGDDLAMEHYAASRLQTLQDSTMPPLDKARRLKQLRTQLPSAYVAALTPSDIQNDVNALTRDWRDAKGTPQELRLIREEMVGSAGADQIEAQDRISAAWKQQLRSFGQQRKAIMNDPTLSETQKEESIERLREQSLIELQRLYTKPAKN